MGKQLQSIEKAVRRVGELDAAGWGIVMLHADREADIRRVVSCYPHLYAPEFKTQDSPDVKYDNMKEALPGGFAKDFFAPHDMPSVPGTEGGETVCEWLVAGLRRKSTAMRHRLLYIPNIHDLIGHDSSRGQGRTPEQLNMLYLLRAMCESKKTGFDHSIVVIGCTDEEPCEALAGYAYDVEIGYPDRAEIDTIIAETCRASGGPHHGLDPASANELAEILRGMRQDDIRNVINLAYAQHEHPLVDGARRLFGAALEAKRQRIAGVRGLRWICGGASDVGGLEEIRGWLEARRAAFNYTYAAKRCEVCPPKGALLAGLPGCGKTLLAKYASHLLGDGNAHRIPVIQMDLSAMLGKYVGESETNFARALCTIEGVAPCVVIVDEIEKFFGGVSDGNSDVNRHIFARLLDWMQDERDKPVLVIATANKVDRLPPELKRKGRFDETFFVGIPTRADCGKILRIHLKRKRKVLGDLFDSPQAVDEVVDAFLDEAARKSRFFNGADIESIVDAAFCKLFGGLPHEEIERIQKAGDEAPGVTYALNDIRRALLTELDHTRSYFENNMKETAEYWVAMRKLNFRDAGSTDLFAGISYSSDEGTFAFADVPQDGDYEKTLEERAADAAKDADYDAAFRYKLAPLIHRYVQREKNSRNGGGQ